MRMLEDEGFVFENYIDNFDGGPTMIAQTDRIATIRRAREATVTAIGEDEAARPCLAAQGSLAAFRATFARVSENGTIDSPAAGALGACVGDAITVVDV